MTFSIPSHEEQTMWEMIDGYQASQEEHLAKNSLDAFEMDLEMHKFLVENQTHTLMADNHFNDRVMDRGLTRRSEMDSWVTITSVGDDYATAESDYGMVYIPNHLSAEVFAENDLILMKLQFKGFEGARTTVMPWRAVKHISKERNLP